METAKKVAANYFSSASIGILKSGEKPDKFQFLAVSTATQNNDTLYYILNDTINNCFVIVAGDNSVWPILGYSSKGIFNKENQPPAFVYWMETWKQKIAYIKQNNLKSANNTNKQWSKLSTSVTDTSEELASIEPLISTKWDQDCYYNSLCPEDVNGPCGRVLTGCIATSMSQIMKYWNFPETGVGSHTYTHSVYGSLSADFESTTYKWSQMPNHVTYENEAVATLMFHCGVASNTYYNPYNSVAVFEKNALINYFNYSADIQEVHKKNYSSQDWINLLKNELNLLRPVWYSGFDPISNGGHAFICDGYQNSDYFHFNWGWGGYADGYFYMGGDNFVFSSDQVALIKIFPSDLPDGYRGFSLSDNYISKGANGGTDSVKIISGVNWIASSNQTWLTLKNSNGTIGNSQLIFEVEPNNSDSSRTAVITITASGFNNQTITLTQPAKVYVTPGELKNVLKDVLASTINLTLSGTIDARDFKTLRNEMPVLAEIDLSGVSIVEYNGADGTSNWGNNNYAANTIPEFAFLNENWKGKASLTSFVFPENVTVIGIAAFGSCYGLSSISIPNSVTIIRQYAFYNCWGMTSISMPSNVINIETAAFFYFPGLIHVDNENPNYSSTDGVLYNKNKTTLLQCPISKTGSFYIPASVVTIGESAFESCGQLTSVAIPASVKNIEDYAFWDCYSLSSVEIPSSVNAIGNGFFAYCNSLSSITAGWSVPPNLSSVTQAFTDVNKTTCTLYVPFGSKAEYQAANIWKDFLNIVEIPEESTVCQTLAFKTGWNISSVSLSPDSINLVKVFQPLMTDNSLVKIMDEEGSSLEDWGIYGGWKNNIGNVSPTEGYKVKVSEDYNFEICGAPFEYPFAIPLKSGWNIMGYPQTEAFDALEVLKPLITAGKLVKVQDEAGNSIEDWGIYGGWKNNIGDFVPGKGYNIKLNSDETLWINENYPKSSSIQPEQFATNHFKTEFEGNGLDHMNINLVGLPVNVFRVGDELAIFDGSTCVGVVTIFPRNMQSQTASIAASARDNQGMPGFAEGNLITLKLWNSKQNTEFILKPEIVKGTNTFAKHETTFASLEKYAATGLEEITGNGLTEINCFPNPFSDEVTVEIKLAKDSEVQVEVLNQLGQRVSFLQTGKMMNGGVHRLIWDGKNADNQQVSTGIYHLRITVNDNVLIRKMVYSK